MRINLCVLGLNLIMNGGARLAPDPERVVNLKDWHMTGYFSYWMGLDPTDAPLLLRGNGTSDLYALTLEEK